MARPIILELEHGFHSKIISVSFDGVCVTDNFPQIGRDIGAAPVLKKLITTGHRIILNTIRSDQAHPLYKELGIVPEKGMHLTAALKWFRDNDIELWAVNENPLQCGWTYSLQVGADLYINCKALGTPMSGVMGTKQHVDWNAVDIWLDRNGWYWNSLW